VRASRLLQLILLLQANGRTTAERIASELEVSVRTVYRDVEALSQAGVPVYAEPGHGGGIELVGGYQTRLTGLSEPEVAALSLAGVPGAAAQLGLGQLLGVAQAKVDASLPPQLRRSARLVRERFLVDLPGWFRRADDVPLLPAVSAAVWDGVRLDVRYRRGERVVRRRLDPLGLVLKGGTWYLVAGARRPDGVRSYRVDRLQAVAPRSERVARPDGFDLARAWAEAGRSFARDLQRLEVRALIAADRLGRLRAVLPDPAGADAAASAGPAGSDGRCEVLIRSESVDVAHDELLPLAADVEVLEPRELRERLAATGRLLAVRHGAATGRAGRPGARGAQMAG